MGNRGSGGNGGLIEFALLVVLLAVVALVVANLIGPIAGNILNPFILSLTQ